MVEKASCICPHWLQAVIKHNKSFKTSKFFSLLSAQKTPVHSSIAVILLQGDKQKAIPLHCDVWLFQPMLIIKTSLQISDTPSQVKTEVKHLRNVFHK